MTTDKHEVLLRMRAIELLAYWEGRLVTNRLMSWFGLSRQQASADIKRYNTLYNPDALIHDPSVKGYVPKASFQPVLTTAHINELMCAEKTGGFNLVNYRHSSGVYHEQETEDLHRRI